MGSLGQNPWLSLTSAGLQCASRAVPTTRGGFAWTGALFCGQGTPQPHCLTTLKEEGCDFDIATQGEIDLLEQCSIPPQRTIHTHPIKRDIDIRTSLRYGCTTFVVDNMSELKKFLPYRERVGLLLRLAFSNRYAVVDLSKKFGLDVAEAPAFITKAESLGIRIKGLSFHVGSQSTQPEAHVLAIKRCTALLESIRDGAGAPLSLLDIGGGFPIAYAGFGIDIKPFCAPIRSALKTLPDYVQVIAEPGRFIAAPAMTCLTSVIGKTQRQHRPWYYLDDGVYGSFSGQIFDHARYPIYALKQGARTESVLAGPTCDSIDIITSSIQLPQLEIGDLIIATMMGAYTSATATAFNFIPKTPIAVLNDIKKTIPSMRRIP